MTPKGCSRLQRQRAKLLSGGKTPKGKRNFKGSKKEGHIKGYNQDSKEGTKTPKKRQDSIMEARLQRGAILQRKGQGSKRGNTAKLSKTPRRGKTPKRGKNSKEAGKIPEERVKTPK